MAAAVGGRSRQHPCDVCGTAFKPDDGRYEYDCCKLRGMCLPCATMTPWDPTSRVSCSNCAYAPVVTMTSSDRECHPRIKTLDLRATARGILAHAKLRLPGVGNYDTNRSLQGDPTVVVATATEQGVGGIVLCGPADGDLNEQSGDALRALDAALGHVVATAINNVSSLSLSLSLALALSLAVNPPCLCCFLRLIGCVLVASIQTPNRCGPARTPRPSLRSMGTVPPGPSSR